MKRLVIALALIAILAGPIGAVDEPSQRAVQPLSLTYAFCDTAAASDTKVIDIPGHIELVTFSSDQPCSLRYVAKITGVFAAPGSCYRLGAGAVLDISNRYGIDSLFVYNESASTANHALLGQRR